MTDETLTQDGMEALAADILNGSGDSADGNNPSIGNQDQVLTDMANELLGVEQSSDPEPEAVEEDPVSDDEDETSEGSDDESPVEADEDEQEGDEPTDDVSEYFEVDYEDAKDGIYPIKINGEVKMMKFSEIQNQLARSESASKKSQEANQRQEELATREAKIAEAEAFAQQRIEAANSSVELGKIDAAMSNLQQQYNKAVEAQDSHKMIMLDANMKKVQEARHKTEAKIVQVQEEAKMRHTQSQQALLKDKGYGDILNDSYVDYVSSNLSDQALNALNLDATLVILAEKARKWDASQGKAKRTLKKSKSLRAGGGNIKQAQTNKAAAKQKQMAAGQGNQDEAILGLDNIAKDILGLS